MFWIVTGDLVWCRQRSTMGQMGEMIATDNVGCTTKLIDACNNLGPKCSCVRERKNQEKSFIVSGQLPLWNHLALVSASAFQAFQKPRPPPSATWFIQLCELIYILGSTMYLCRPQSFYLLCRLCWQSGIPLFPWTAMSV